MRPKTSNVALDARLRTQCHGWQQWLKAILCFSFQDAEGRAMLWSSLDSKRFSCAPLAWHLASLLRIELEQGLLKYFILKSEI